MSPRIRMLQTFSEPECLTERQLKADAHGADRGD